MTVLHLSDTHGLHGRLGELPSANVLVHSGDISQNGTEKEVLDFLNWFIALDCPHKIFVAGNHDLCLRPAAGIENLPANVHFLQDRSVTIDGVTFFGLGYDHSEKLIPMDGVDVLVTHEPPLEVLDFSSGRHWGNLPLRNSVEALRPKCHLFGHAHEGYGTEERDGTIFSNAALLNDRNRLVNPPRLIVL